MEAKIELIKENDIADIENVIARAARQTMAIFYPDCSVEYVIETLSGQNLIDRINETHFYIVKLDDKVIGCGAIGPYCDSETESSLFNIFIDPDSQGKGFGKQLVRVLENDEYGKRAKRIEIPASITGIPFYRRLGYKFKNNELIYEDGHFKMEKYMK